MDNQKISASAEIAESGKIQSKPTVNYDGLRAKQQPYFETTADSPGKVDGNVGGTVHLHCVIRNLGARVVSRT